MVKEMKPETVKRIIQFTVDRDWDKFHSPANLAKSISIEANELLECFQWDENNYDIESVKEELATFWLKKAAEQGHAEAKEMLGF